MQPPPLPPSAGQPAAKNGQSTAPPQGGPAVVKPGSSATPAPAPQPGSGATPAPPAGDKKPGAQLNVQTCQECKTTAAWGSTSWCPACGYYPKIGRKVDVDKPEEDVEPEPPKNAWQLLPVYVKFVIFACLAALAEVVIAAVLVWNTDFRPQVGGIHLVLGLLCTLVAQARAYFFGVEFTDKYGLFSIITNPLAIWKPALTALPRTQRMLNMVFAGMIVALGGVAMINRDFERIFEVPESVRRRPVVALQSPNDAVNSIVEKVPEKKEQDLEPAMRESAPKCGVCGGVAEAVRRAKEREANARKRLEALRKKPGKTPTTPLAEKKPEPVKELPKTECTVMGYLSNREGEVTTLLLAGRKGTESLRFVGRLELSTLTEMERDALVMSLKRNRVSRPLVKCPYGGNWVKSDYKVSVAYDRWGADGMLVDAEMYELLDFPEDGLLGSSPMSRPGDAATPDGVGTTPEGAAQP